MMRYCCAEKIARLFRLFQVLVEKLPHWLGQFECLHPEAVPGFLNIDRILGPPQVAALVAERTPIKLYRTDAHDWQYTSDVAKPLGWEKNRFESTGRNNRERSIPGINTRLDKLLRSRDLYHSAHPRDVLHAP